MTRVQRSSMESLKSCMKKCLVNGADLFLIPYIQETRAEYRKTREVIMTIDGAKKKVNEFKFKGKA